MEDLPYFKFYTGEWLAGDIQEESPEVIGHFINLLSRYWARGCDMSKKKAVRIVGDDAFSLLSDEGHIKTNGSKICINFLDRQMAEFTFLKENRKKAGRKGGKQRQDNIENQALTKQDSSKAIAKEDFAKALRGEERREEEIRENNTADKTLEAIYSRIRKSIENHSEIERQRTTKAKSKAVIKSCLKSNLTEADICNYWHNYLKVKEEAQEKIAGFGNYVKPEDITDWVSSRKEAKAMQSKVEHDRQELIRRSIEKHEAKLKAEQQQEAQA